MSGPLGGGGEVWPGRGVGVWSWGEGHTSPSWLHPPGHTSPSPNWSHPPLWTEWVTHACENINFARFTMQAVNIRGVVRKKHWPFGWNWFLTVYSYFSLGLNYVNTVGVIDLYCNIICLHFNSCVKIDNAKGLNYGWWINRFFYFWFWRRNMKWENCLFVCKIMLLQFLKRPSHMRKKLLYIYIYIYIYKIINITSFKICLISLKTTFVKGQFYSTKFLIRSSNFPHSLWSSNGLSC